jgi:DNA-binding MarR family transcriptional regulator
MIEPVTQQTITQLLLEAVRALEADLGPALEDRGAFELTATQARVLLLVDRTGTRLTELARRGGVTKQAMMQMIDDLQALGCVRRAPDPLDARAKVVRLTAKGLRQRAGARKALQMVEGRLKRRLGPRRYEALLAGLEELAAPEE